MNLKDSNETKRRTKDLKARAERNPSAPQLVVFVEEKYTKLTEIRKNLA